MSFGNGCFPGSSTLFFTVLGCRAEIRSSRETSSQFRGHTHARAACRAELRSGGLSLRSVPWPQVWRPGRPCYWPSSSGRPHGGWWAAAESSSTRSPWSPQSYTSTRCGRRLNAACVCPSCGNAPWPNRVRRSDEAQTFWETFLMHVKEDSSLSVSLCVLVCQIIKHTHTDWSGASCPQLCRTHKTTLWGARQTDPTAHHWDCGKTCQQKFTSVLDGEVSEPDELILDNSSTDMDFSLSLREIKARLCWLMFDWCQKIWGPKNNTCINQ